MYLYNCRSKAGYYFLLHARDHVRWVHLYNNTGEPQKGAVTYTTANNLMNYESAFYTR